MPQIDTIKTRIQKATALKGETAWTRFTTVASQMFRDEGPQAFYKGITPRVMRVAPGQAVRDLFLFLLLVALRSFFSFANRSSSRCTSESRLIWNHKKSRKSWSTMLNNCNIHYLSLSRSLFSGLREAQDHPSIHHRSLHVSAAKDQLHLIKADIGYRLLRLHIFLREISPVVFWLDCEPPAHNLSRTIRSLSKSSS